MYSRRIASIGAVVGGVAWLLKVVLIWMNGGESTDAGLVPALDVLGWAVLFVALAAAGYTLVEKAPVWLRLVVAVATPLLVLILWALADEGIQAVYTQETWLREELSLVVAGVIAVGMGLWGLRRKVAAHSAPDPAPVRPVRGRRAAR